MWNYGAITQMTVPFWGELWRHLHLQVHLHHRLPRRWAAAHQTPANLQTAGGASLVHRHQNERARSEI